jgi:photosystem II stability/assembly factor-like uncharacterized protein
MKKFSLAFFLFSLLICAQQGGAQGITFIRDDGRGGRVTATWQHPLPQGNTIRDLCFVDSRHGWAVGYFGTILHTTDGGEHWSAQSSGTTESLMDCSFIDREHGWVNGVEVLLRTTNGGEHWTSIHRPPSGGERDNIRGVAMPATGTVIVTTGLDGIWRSTDNGGEWRRVHSLSSPDHVCFTDAMHGWVAGENGRIIRTTDGGATWTEHWVVARGRAPLHFPHLLYFSDSLRGWIASEMDSYASTDGGRNWTRCCDTMRQVLGIAMTDSLRGWARGLLGLYRTADGGVSWDPYPNAPAGMPEHLVFATPDSAWAAGYRGAIMRSTDGGLSWQGNLDAARASFSAVQTPSPDTAWAVGSGIFRTTNGGMNWLSLAHPGSGTFTGAFFFDGRSGVCIGKDGLVLSTTDAGSTWTQQTIAPGQLPTDVFFLDRERGYIATLEGSIFPVSYTHLTLPTIYSV